MLLPMESLNETCQKELEENGIIPKKYHGQVFTTDPRAIEELIIQIKSIYKPGTKVVEIGGGLGYITQELQKHFEDIDVLEIDDKLFDLLNKKFDQYSNIQLVHKDILEYKIPEKDYMLVGNIPFHVSGQLYKRFMSLEKHKPYGMVFITDHQYAKTLAGQPPRSYRSSLQAQAYGIVDITMEITKDSVFPPPKVKMCVMKITHDPTGLPKNFWETVNHHFDNFPTPEVESPKTMSLQDWITLSRKAS